MPIICKFFVIFIFAPFALKAMDLAFIESKPKGIARDFYIYVYLEDNAKISKDDALKLYNLIDNKSYKIMSLLKSRIPTQTLPSDAPKDAKCRSKRLHELLISDDECFNMGFSLNYAIHLKPKDIERIESPITKRRVEILRNRTKILEKILDSSGEDFNAIYNAISNKGAIFNTAPKNLKNLSNKNFDKSLYHLIISKKYPKFTRALLRENIVGVNDWSAFALGLNELENGSKKKALAYFQQSADNASFKLMRDKSLFWLYKINEVLKDKAKSDEFLNTLAQSTHFNLYSLYAVKKLNTNPKYYIIDENNEIFKEITQKANAPFDISDPFAWQKMRSEIIDIQNKESLVKVAKLLYHKESVPHLIFVLNRYFNFQKSFFVKPYKDNLTFDDENLVYAVARQESAFIPSVISRSYALGMMQIMPFNVENFAKALKAENITYESMFDPRIALRFGDYYLAHLKKEFSHPLFVSYAYNGGPTFIRGFLKDAKNFSAKNPLDPWLSMEFIPYEESRFYGFSVMANYLMYEQIDGESIDMDAFFAKTLR